MTSKIPKGILPTQRAASKVRPLIKRTFRALGRRKIVVEGFGRKVPAFVLIVGGSDVPVGVWISPAELRRLITVARRILK